MVNWPGIRAALALTYRPAIALPHITVPSIAHLDWHALRAAGVRALVFDKDNCLAKPHTFTLEPAIVASFQQAIATFGLSRILIVSNSAGASSDFNGLRAERLSRSFGGVPVLCHPQKKPGSRCARLVIEHFERVQSGLVQVHGRPTAGFLTHRPEDVLAVGTSLAPPDVRWTKKDGALPPFEGAIAVIGDRTLTDVVLAHRIGDELLHRRGRGSRCCGSSTLNPLPTSFQTPAGSSSSSSSTVAVASLLLANPPPPHMASPSSPNTHHTPGIAILTSAIWAREGLVNDFMRFLERIWVRMLSRRGFEPGQRGWRSSHYRPHVWQKVITPSSETVQRVAQAPTKQRSRLDIGVLLNRLGFTREPKVWRPNSQLRSMSTSAPPSGGPTSSKEPPQRNYTQVVGAALGFFVVVPFGVYAGFKLKDWTESSSAAKAIENTQEGYGLLVGQDSSTVQAAPSTTSPSAESERRAKLKRLQELKTESFYMLRERQEVEEKMERLQQRRGTS
ncbi:hypothetical protein CF327_g4267 [Tilletia walkeri]|uniref:Uncharacterized protein n=1 Tax=Tilletia walkeri TaxID=117179 RepID=A0A8X7NDD5_9BASI|nr:hypothetical protein CF327_g4267 [Tilletia walkeri]KAE8269931.1 hypothetical protein A4X09_0g2413 [Tilletia walkeri]